jgi:nicotinamidase-related amidase
MEIIMEKITTGRGIRLAIVYYIATDGTVHSTARRAKEASAR